MNAWCLGAGGVFAATTVVSLAMMAGPIRTMRRASGVGIVPFELAGTNQGARQILAGWGDDGVAAARRSLHLDFPFLIGYAGLGAVLAACSAEPVGDAGWAWMTPVTWGAAVGAVLAGVLDTVENLALLRVISASPDLGADLGPDARVARQAALAKFGLLLLVFGWLVLVVLPVLVLR
jgi:hypothetical protein